MKSPFRKRRRNKAEQAALASYKERTKRLAPMRCPYCGQRRNQVIDTRLTEDNQVRRRHSCVMCLGRWTTYEAHEPDDLVRERNRIARRENAKTKCRYCDTPMTAADLVPRYATGARLEGRQVDDGASEE